jgi:hypothetical protein
MTEESSISTFGQIASTFLLNPVPFLLQQAKGLAMRAGSGLVAACRLFFLAGFLEALHIALFGLGSPSALR